MRPFLLTQNSATLVEAPVKTFTDRYAAIEHENRILLNKMSEIMRKSTMEENKAQYRFGHSMNRTRRKAELQRITEENQVCATFDTLLGFTAHHPSFAIQKILHRIQRATPVYNHWEWEEEREKQEELIEQMCEYKPPLLKKSKRRGLAATGQASLQQHPGNQYMQEEHMQGGGISGYYLDAPPTGSAQGSYMMNPGMSSGSIGYTDDAGSSQFGGHFLGTAGSMGSYASQFGGGSAGGSVTFGAPGSAATAGFGAAAAGHGGS